MTMHKEALRGYLHNFPLVQAIEQKMIIDDTQKKLLSALQTLREAGVSEIATTEVQNKYDEYGNISRGYSEMLENTWHISWQEESVILKYTSGLDDDIDRLPEYIKFD